MDLETDTIDELFEQKFLSQTKKLANGKEIRIFSRQARGNSFIYSCHLCGFIELGDELALHLHVMDKMHKSLLNLKLLPLKSWMKEVVVEEKEVADKKPCALGCGDCSDLKAMLESMCGMKPTGKTTSKATTSFSNVNRSSLKRTATPDKGGSSRSLEKKRRDRSPKARRSRSRSRKSTKHRNRSPSKKRSAFNSSSESDALCIQRNQVTSSSSLDERKFTEIDVTVKRSHVANDDPPPTFLTVCRCLITLEQHIIKYSSEINRFFSSSLNLERQKTGSSNELLTPNNLMLLENIKHHLKDQIVLGLLPLQMLGIARNFVNDFDRLVKENIPPEMPEAQDMLIKMFE